MIHLDVSHDAFTDWWDTYVPLGTPQVQDGPLLGQKHRLFGMTAEDIETVEKAHSENPLRVWTVVEIDGALQIVVGRHANDCIGYFITRKPAARLCERVALT